MVITTRISRIDIIFWLYPNHAGMDEDIFKETGLVEERRH
jgi:hypothetical protein